MKARVPSPVSVSLEHGAQAPRGTSEAEPGHPPEQPGLQAQQETAERLGHHLEHIPVSRARGGQSLPGGVRGRMERAFNTHFPEVRIHESALPARLGARAALGQRVSVASSAPGHSPQPAGAGASLQCASDSESSSEEEDEKEDSESEERSSEEEDEDEAASAHIGGVRDKGKEKLRSDEESEADSEGDYDDSDDGDFVPPKQSTGRRQVRSARKKISEEASAKSKRPPFRRISKKRAIRFHNLLSDHPFLVNENKPELPAHNAAIPHRFPWKALRDNTEKFHTSTDPRGAEDFSRFTDRFLSAGSTKIKSYKQSARQAEENGDKERARQLRELVEWCNDSQHEFEEARDKYVELKTNKEADQAEIDKAKRDFLAEFQNFHSNIPDLGPHQGVNNPVKDALHLNLMEAPTASNPNRVVPSPHSSKMLLMTPTRVPGLPYSGNRVITTRGTTVSPARIASPFRRLVRGFKRLNIRSFKLNAQFGPSTSTVTTEEEEQSDSSTSTATTRKKQERGKGSGKKGK